MLVLPQSTELQFVITGVPENDPTFFKQIENDSKLVDEAVRQLGLQPSGNINSIKRLGKRLNLESKQPRKCHPLLITTTNRHFMNNCFARSHYLQSFHTPVYVKEFPSVEDRKLEKEILSKRYNLIQKEGYDRSLFKTKKLKLFYNDKPVHVSTP